MSHYCLQQLLDVGDGVGAVAALETLDVFVGLGVFGLLVVFEFVVLDQDELIKIE